MKKDYLTTHDKFDFKDLLLNHKNDILECCYVIIKPKNQRTGYEEERGKWVTKFWNQVIQSIPEIQGHRLSWTNLVFFKKRENNSFFRDQLISILKQTQEPNLKSVALFSELNGSFENKFEEIDLMELQLIKLDYWIEHKYPEYFENGIQKNLTVT